MTITGFSKPKIQPLNTQRPVRRMSAFSTMAFHIALAVAATCLSATTVLSQTGEAQTQANGRLTANTTAALPRLIKFSGTLLDSRGYPITVATDVTFALYAQPYGDSSPALWKETQQVTPNEEGSYTIYLGSASAYGLPTELFNSAAAQWLGARVDDEQELPRVPLVSVPYALKAGDAQTLGGLPASAYALASTVSNLPSFSTSPSVTPIGTTVTTTGGGIGYVPMFSATSAIQDSIIFQTDGGVAIGRKSVGAMFDVAGSTLLEGPVNLPKYASATSTAGSSSYPLVLTAETYNSTTKATIDSAFSWQAEPANNNTANASGTLNLYYSANDKPSPIGMYFNADGTIHFATGQTFPGTGSGTITGVTAGIGLLGGGTSGAISLRLDTTKVPLLSTANSFAGNQAVTGTETVTGDVTTGADLLLPNTISANVGVVQLGTTPFLSNYGPANSHNGFMAGAGNFKTTTAGSTGTGYSALSALTTGYENAAHGLAALQATTTGSYNTAMGAASLSGNLTGEFNTGLGFASGYRTTTGNSNTAIGTDTLIYNTTGSNNTALGVSAGPAIATTNLINATALGADATVGQSNTLILGQTVYASPGDAFVNVGIGTATPISTLEASVSAEGGLGPVLTLTNPGGDSKSSYGSAALDFNTQPVVISGYIPGARIQAFDDGNHGDTLRFVSNKPGSANNGYQTNMVISSNGNVGIGIFDPSGSKSQLQVDANTTQLTAITGSGPADVGAGGGSGVAGFGGNTALSGSDAAAGTGGVFGGGNSVSPVVGGEGILAAGGNFDFLSNRGPQGLAGYFIGNVQVEGTVSSSNSAMVMDHPLDPANKYFSHSSVGSSEMVNIYSGNVVTDELGIATVNLPDWFETVNGDFRYQLTVVGVFAQAIVSKEIQDHRFIISTNATHVKVSWQVTGVRHDAYATAHPLVVEELKPAKERGFYMHPQLYGQPGERQTSWGRNPRAMQQIKAQKERTRQSQEHPQEGAQLTAQSGTPATAVNRIFTPRPTPQIPPVSQPVGQTNPKK